MPVALPGEAIVKPLRELYEERQASNEFRKRNKTYDELQKVFDSEDRQPGGDDSYRPNLQDPTQGGDAQRDAEEIVVNQTRRVVNHFTATFAYPPRITVLPLILERDQSKFVAADALTQYNDHVNAKSNLATLHPRVSHWLSLRGDAMFGVDWGLLGGWGSMGNLKRGVRIFTFDPRHCYPLISNFDPGACDDMLIALTVTREQAKEMYGVTDEQLGTRHDPRVFYYWNSHVFRAAIEDHVLKEDNHELGFCPFRWIFGDPSGKFAQSDVREVPKLQRTFNEGLLLAIDAIRKQVDGSWWYSADETKEIEPTPGHVDPLGPGADVGRWEIAADPQIILGVMRYLEDSIQATTGVSPISMSGAAPQTSHVTGAAVRHQVEAAEARSETRKALLQAAYSRLAEYVLMVTRLKFPGEVMLYRSGEKLNGFKADQIAMYVEAEAEYGGFLGLPVEQRVQLAMTGLGHLWDDEWAVDNVVDLPGTNGAVMSQRVAAYLVRQAKAQAQAQQAQQQGEGGEEGGAPGAPQAPGGPPPTMARPQRPVPPNGPQLRSYLARQGGPNGH